MRYYPASHRYRLARARRRNRLGWAVLVLAGVAVVEWTLWPWG